MHPTTKDNLETLYRWIAETIAADALATKLGANLPEREDDGPYHAFSTNFGGNFAIHVYQAPGLDTVKPYLRAARLAGFEREGELKQDATQNTATWNYRAKADDDRAVTLSVVLHFLTATSSGETARCRYVEVGKKEVPDMKLLCGDALAEWEAAQKVEA